MTPPLMTVLLPNYPDKYRAIAKLHKKYSKKGLEVIAVHQRLKITWAGRVEEKDIIKFIKRHDVQFPICIDDNSQTFKGITENLSGNGAMYSVYDVKATPALYLIDKKGVVRVSPKKNELEKWITKLLDESTSK